MKLLSTEKNLSSLRFLLFDHRFYSSLPAVGTGIPRVRSKLKANSCKSEHTPGAECEVIQNAKIMKPIHLVTAAALLAAGGLWFAWSSWREHTSRESSNVVFEPPQAHASNMPVGTETPPAEPSNTGNNSKRPTAQTMPDRMPSPPELNRRFKDFTPEQRVEFARRGHGPGG
jgi:hypothetical protein